ncbi:chromosome segregation protein ParM [Shewanella baltica]|uniref:chromosome segregation protein ParM n=1 Tax=Shewanella baltica TaxID=62322 RepID=UPI0024B99095|nr:chromosome segregation protein ParM [Shewanella baltica]
MRLSSTQKDVLFILYAIEAGGKAEPVPGIKILEMINSARQSGIYGTNFRISCHTLVENGLLKKYRDTSLKLAFKLTEYGRKRAEEIYLKRLEEDQDK